MMKKQISWGDNVCSVSACGGMDRVQLSAHNIKVIKKKQINALRWKDDICQRMIAENRCWGTYLSTETLCGEVENCSPCESGLITAAVRKHNVLQETSTSQFRPIAL